VSRKANRQIARDRNIVHCEILVLPRYPCIAGFHGTYPAHDAVRAGNSIYINSLAIRQKVREGSFLSPIIAGECASGKEEKLPIFDEL
jgi:hypothetical protein